MGKVWKNGDVIQTSDLNSIEERLDKLTPFSDHLISFYNQDNLTEYKYGDYVIDKENNKLYRAKRNFPNTIQMNDSWEEIENLGQALGIIDQNSKNAIESISQYIDINQDISYLYYLNDQLQRTKTTKQETQQIKSYVQQISLYISNLYQLNDTIERNKATKQELFNLEQQVQLTNQHLNNADNIIQQFKQHIPALYYLNESLSQDLNHINEYIANLNDQINLKYMSNEAYIGKTTSELGILHTELDEVQQELPNKQNITPMIEFANLYSEIDTIEHNTHTKVTEIQDISAPKIAAEAFIIEIDKLNREMDKKIDKQDFLARISTINGMLLNNLEILEKQISINRTDIYTNNTRISNLSSTLNQYVLKPINSNGTTGQVLSTKGDGTTQWVDNFTPESDEIADAVATWLDNNPAATTTVADHSVTLAKLSQQVINLINNSEDAQEALTLIQALINDYQMHLNDDLEHRQFINMKNDFQNKLLIYAGHFNCGRYNNTHSYLEADGFGFLFFTDPHLIDGKSYGHPPEKLLKGLQIVRNLLDMTPAHYVICGGDWLNEGYRPNNNDETGANIKAQALAVLGSIPNLLRDRISERVYNIAGNHEYIYGLHGSNELTEKHLAHLWYDKDVNYYTIDTNTTKCYLFDSGTMATDMTDYRWTQVQWFGNLLLNSTVPHHFGAIHIAYLNGDGENGIKSTPELLIDNLCKIANAFNNKTTITLNNITYNFSNTIGKFHFMLAGHLHGDFNFTINNIPVILSRGFLRGYAVDGVYANFSEAKLYLTRFGQGSDREFSIISND